MPIPNRKEWLLRRVRGGFEANRTLSATKEIEEELLLGEVHLDSIVAYRKSIASMMMSTSSKQDQEEQRKADLAKLRGPDPFDDYGREEEKH